MTEHRDVAAYALGLLDDRAAANFEEHLIGCEACAAELDSMIPVMEALADVDPATLTDQAPVAPIPAQLPGPGRRRDEGWHQPTGPAGHPGPGRPGQRQAPPRPLNRRHRLSGRPRVLAFATAFVAVVLLAVGGLIVGAQWTGGQPDQVTAGGSSSPKATGGDQGPGIGGDDVPAGKKYEATDPVSGVHALVLVDSKPWGTQVSYAISRLEGPLTCRLRLVKANGSTEVAASWNVPPAGYGTDKQPQPLELQAATATAADDLALVQVQSVAQNGVVSTLVEVPL